jgi:hypothetical protein
MHIAPGEQPVYGILTDQLSDTRIDRPPILKKNFSLFKSASLCMFYTQQATLPPQASQFQYLVQIFSSNISAFCHATHYPLFICQYAALRSLIEQGVEIHRMIKMSFSRHHRTFSSGLMYTFIP